MDTRTTISVTVGGAEKSRLDNALVEALQKDYSRAFCQKLIKSGRVYRDGIPLHRSSELIIPGTILSIVVSEEDAGEVQERRVVPGNFNVRLIYEHEHFAIISKPAGLLVHTASTAAGEPTLVDWIQATFPASVWDVSGVRPGIVHRLDRDTSGLMIIVKTPQAHARFSALFKDRAITKCYHAVVYGSPVSSGSMDWNIVRHPRNRLLMTYSRTKGREAFSSYKVLEYFEEAALIEVLPKTGRTHQVRVHCAAMGHALVGDGLYYHKKSPLDKASQVAIKRHALHAARLSFTYDGQPYEFECPYPEDMQRLILSLRSA